MSLREWGWTAERESEAAGLVQAGWRIGRVIGQGRGLYLLAGEETARAAAVSGSFSYRAALPADYPVTGDFVACREEGGSWVIERVLARRGTLSRKAAGRKGEEQVLAANLDEVFLVFAAGQGRGFTPRLVERLLALVRESGALPVILLNKCDLAEDREAFLEEACAVAPGVEVLLISARTGENLDALRERLVPGRTFFFLGKSGVGKSSLINALSGDEMLKTAAIREQDGRGRHTTTSRDLFRLPGGALLVDAPGLREAALWVDEASVDETFPDVAALAAECRFRDCRHQGEPGCAVQQALVEGSLDHRRYESYLDYRREARYHHRLADENARRQELLRWKKISRQQREIYRERDLGG